MTTVRLHSCSMDCRSQPHPFVDPWLSRTLIDRQSHSMELVDKHWAGQALGRVSHATIARSTPPSESPMEAIECCKAPNSSSALAPRRRSATKHKTWLIARAGHSNVERLSCSTRARLTSAGGSVLCAFICTRILLHQLHFAPTCLRRLRRHWRSLSPVAATLCCPQSLERPSSSVPVRRGCAGKRHATLALGNMPNRVAGMMAGAGASRRSETMVADMIRFWQRSLRACGHACQVHT